MGFSKEKFLNSLSVNLSDERVEQKNVYRKAVDFYNCNSKAHLDSILKNQFVDYEKVKESVIFRELGMTKGIVDNISLVYSNKPTRNFKVGDSNLNEKLQGHIDSIYDKIGNSFFQVHEKLVNTMSQCSVLVTYENDSIKLILMTPDKYDVIQNELDYTKADAYYFQIDSKDDMTNKQKVTSFIYVDSSTFGKIVVGQTWAKDKVVTETALNKTELSPLDNLDSTENIYNTIPVVTTRSETPVNDFFVDSNSRLFESNESTLVLKDVSANKTAFLQGYSQLVHTQNSGSAMSESVSDAFRVGVDVKVNLENGITGGQLPEKLEFLSPNTDLSQLNQDVKEKYLQTASIFGLGESDGNVKANASGLSLVVSDDKKNKLINANRPTYVQFESDLFDLIRIVNNKHSNITIHDNVTINVDFQEITTTVGLQDKIDWYNFELDQELKADWEILIEDNPELTEKLAKEQIQRARQTNKQKNIDLMNMTDDNNKEEIE